MKANDFIKKFGWERVKHCKKPSSRDNFFIVGGELNGRGIKQRVLTMDFKQAIADVEACHA